MARKIRLDKLLVDKGLFESREKAQEAIEKGLIIVTGKSIVKPSSLVDENTPVKIKEELRYVSRGGYKLEKALSVFRIAVKDLDCLDIGSSTGGFVDCLLKHGARRIIALDVGRSLLHPDLVSDERVFVLERINARYIEPKILPFLPDLVTCDVSFISIQKIFPAVLKCFKKTTEGVFLIKPQFEAGRKYVKKGIVKDPDVHKGLLRDFKNYFLSQGFNSYFTFSPIKGTKGNIEYLCYITKRELPELNAYTETDKIVKDAFNYFSEKR
ncbi:MAG: TlyA family RNA methyltransferase [Actinobacteria bacterium]|nr:TlyA family RNA methyltransferase [Actinomycetota bacterium]